MTQKRDRIVAWAIRKDAVAKVTARLKGEEPRPVLHASQIDLRAYARSRLVEWYGGQWDKVVMDATRAACPLVFNHIGALNVVEP